MVHGWRYDHLGIRRSSPKRYRISLGDHDIRFPKGGSSLTTAKDCCGQNVICLLRRSFSAGRKKSDKIPWLAVALAEAAHDRSVDFRWSCGGATHLETFRPISR